MIIIKINKLNPVNKIFAPLLALILLGAGCAPAPSKTPTASNESPTIVIEGSAGGSVMAEAEVILPTLKVDMRSGNFFFEPKIVTASAGQQVEITFDENDGFHTIVIDEINFKQPIKADGTVSFVAPTKLGNYPIYCDVGSHRAKGMEALLVVE